MKKFKLLILGGDHVYGYGVGIGQSFVEQLARRLSREGLSLNVECHAPMSLAAISGLLPRLALQQYDLIVLQPGHYELQRPVSVRTLFSPKTQQAIGNGQAMGVPQCQQPLSLVKRISDTVKLVGLRLIAGLTGLPRLQQTRHELRTVLDELQPCGHNVVLVTPFPHQDAISGWLRQKGRRLFLEEGYRAFMPVFDAYSLLDVGDVCFLPNNQSHLNALGHELVGSALYDFFRAGVMVVGDSSSYRRHE